MGVHQPTDILLSVYQSGRSEAAAVFADVPAIPRMGDWFRFAAADGRMFKGQVERVEWMPYVKDSRTKMTVGIFLTNITMLPTSSISNG